MKTGFEGCSSPELELRLPGDCAGLFFLFLQRGVVLKTEVGCSVRSFFYNRLGLSPEFVENNIKTIFLDGRPVDDIDTAIVKDGCTMALSSAMPGLVGATMRSGGYYASLRGGISHRPEKESLPLSEGFVTLKLFNLVARDLAAVLLESGVCVEKEDLGDFLKDRRSELAARGMEAVLDGKLLDWDAFLGMDWADRMVLMRLNVRQE